MTTVPNPKEDRTAARIVRELRELIAALDRRVPQVHRAGEVAIARSAAALKAEALERIEALERAGVAGASSVEVAGTVPVDV